MSIAVARAGRACLILLLCGTVLEAQPIGGDRPGLTLDQALARTLERNLDLVVFGYQIEAAEGELLQAALRPNPELGVQVQDVIGTGAFAGVRSAETTVTLGWVLERGARERMVDAGHAGVALSRTEAEIARLDAAAETARRFIDCLAFQARLAAGIAAVGYAGDTVEAVRQRVTAGLAPSADLARAEAELARAELLAEDYEHQLVGAYHRLSEQWGDTEPDFGAVAGDLSALPPLEPFEALRERMATNPELARFLSEQRVHEAELALAEAQRRRPWELSAGLRRVEATDDFALVAGLNVPLATRDRNQGRIAAARAEVRRTAAERAAARVRLETALFVLHQELRHDVHIAERLKGDVIPRIESALQETRRAYEAGRYGYLEWRTVQAELLAAESEALEVSAAAHRMMVEIERLTGVQALPQATQ